jgi:hypothetical protein
VTDLHSNYLGSAVARQSQTGHGLNVNDFQQYSAGVVEGMGSLGAGVANAVKGETLQTAARGLEVLISDPGGAAATVGQAALDQGKALMQTAASVASDPAGAAAALNDNPRALGRMLGQAAGDLAVAKIVKDARGGGEGSGAGCGVNSFAPDTPVLTADGGIAISAIITGTLVLAYDEASGTTGAYAVTATIHHIDPTIVLLTVGGETLETTPKHPFFTRERGWVDSIGLHIGEHVPRLNGPDGVVQARSVVPRVQPMYNLTVATAHTFFVGEEGWLVHNACGATTKPKWPNTPQEMDEFLGTGGRQIPDTPGTPGRNKVVWEPSTDVKITYEQHPYHPTAPDYHKEPHWHLDTPGKPHKRYLPGEDIPGY